MTRHWKLAANSVAASLSVRPAAIGPQYQRPVAQAPVAFKEMAGNDQWKMATPSDGLLKGKWWEIFGDPQLNRLEELVDINNQNVKQAEAQFRQARAMVAGQSRQLLSHYRIDPVDHAKRHRRKTGGARNQPELFVPIPATWEPDLWGRVRLSVENAVDNAQVSAADLENIRLSAAGAAGDRLLPARGARTCSNGAARYDRSLREEPAAHDQPL